MVVVRGRFVVTMNSEMKVWKNGGVAVEDGEIVEVGRFEDLKQRYGGEIIGDKWKIVIPGLVNCHYHSREQLAATLFPDGLGEAEWFNNYCLRYHEVLGPDEEKVALELALYAMARNGVTAFSDGGLIYPDVSLTAVEKNPLRIYASTWCWDMPPRIRKTSEQAMKEIDELRRKWAGKHRGLVEVCVTPISVTTCSRELLHQTFSYAKSHQLKTYIHTSSFREEVEKAIQTFGITPVGYLRREGLLRNYVNLLHAVHLTDEDVEWIAESGARVVCCPWSSMKKGKGLAVSGRFPELLKKGVRVGLGADGAPSSQHVDMLRTAGAFAGLFRDARMDAKAVTTTDALKAITSTAADLLGASNRTGSIEKGKRADLVLIDVRHPDFVPLSDPMQALVFSATGSAVDTVMVDGRIIVEHGEVKNVDFEELFRRAEKALEKIASKMGHQIPM
ncbi:MAG: amidohydrolase family protein [Candidatus Caldarchaeum sp.]